jgi:hypothetical protein
LRGSAPASGVEGGARPGRPRVQSHLTPVVVVAVVLAVVVVTQLVVLAILGSEASGGTTQTVCQVNFWVFHLGCSQVTTASPNAQAAGELAQSLEVVFTVMDVVFFGILGLVAVVAYRGPKPARGSRQIGRA